MDLIVLKNDPFLEVFAGSVKAFAWMTDYAPSTAWIEGSWILDHQEWAELEARSLEDEEVTFDYRA